MDLTQCLVSGLPQTGGAGTPWVVVAISLMLGAAVLVVLRKERRAGAALAAVLAIGLLGAAVTVTPAAAESLECSAKISGEAWWDSNDNGIREADEPIMTDVTAKLISSSGDVLLEKRVDGAGRYVFDRLPAGDYRVAFTTTRANAAPTSSLVGSSETDSDATASGSTGLITLTLGQHRRHIDVGYKSSEAKPSASASPSPSTTPSTSPSTTPSSSPSTSSSPSPSASTTPTPTEDPLTGRIGDHVEYNPGGNVPGLPPGGMPGLPVVLLMESGGTWIEVGWAMTDAAGNYEFNDLPAGRYKVGFPDTVVPEEQVDGVFYIFNAWVGGPYGSHHGSDGDWYTTVPAFNLAAGESNMGVDVEYFAGP